MYDKEKIMASIANAEPNIVHVALQTLHCKFCPYLAPE
jgi:hypothetical protein